MIGRQVRFTRLTISPTTTKMDAPTIVSPRYVPAFAASVRSAVRWSANQRATSSSIGSMEDSSGCVSSQPQPTTSAQSTSHASDRDDGDLLPAGAFVAGGVTAVGGGRRGGHGRQSGGRAARPTTSPRALLPPIRQRFDGTFSARRTLTNRCAGDPGLPYVGRAGQRERLGQRVVGGLGVPQGHVERGAGLGAQPEGVVLLADREVAHGVRQPERIGAGRSGQVQQVPRRQAVALAAEQLLGEVRLQALLEQREAGARADVRTERDPDAERQVRAEREHPAAEGGVAGRAVRDRRAAAAEHPQLALVRVHVVREHRPRAEQPVLGVARRVVAAEQVAHARGSPRRSR